MKKAIKYDVLFCVLNARTLRATILIPSTIMGGNKTDFGMWAVNGDQQANAIPTTKTIV